MSEEEVVLTPEGLRRLSQELEFLKVVKRKQVGERIREALLFGDTWENPEYEAAKQEQAFVEGRIQELENLLRSARRLDGTPRGDRGIGVGHRVRLQDLESGEVEEYTIVGSLEADPSASRISNRSPLARALLGRAEGDEVRVQVPAGWLRYRVLAVEVEPVAEEA